MLYKDLHYLLQEKMYAEMRKFPCHFNSYKYFVLATLLTRIWTDKTRYTRRLYVCLLNNIPVTRIFKNQSRVLFLKILAQLSWNFLNWKRQYFYGSEVPE
jgi:hypothetical protein